MAYISTPCHEMNALSAPVVTPTAAESSPRTIRGRSAR